MSGDRLELRGLRVLARCGVGAAEREVAQPLEIDLDVVVDLGLAGTTDDVGDTVDYGGVCTAAVSATTEPAALLEHVAERVADAVLAGDARIASTVVAVRKLRPPVPHHLATAGVRISRARSS